MRLMESRWIVPFQRRGGRQSLEHGCRALERKFYAEKCQWGENLWRKEEEISIRGD